MGEEHTYRGDNSQDNAVGDSEIKRQAPRNLLTHFEDTIAAMRDIEGENWWDFQQEQREIGQLDGTVFGALEDLKAGAVRRRGLLIAGEHNYNRYIVKRDGKVTIAVMNNPQERERAHALGFEDNVF